MVEGGGSADDIAGTVDESSSDVLDQELDDIDEIEDPDEESLDLDIEGLDGGLDPVEVADADDADDADAPDDLTTEVDGEDVAELLVEDLEDADEGLREGEFICASCHLVKGPTQLANARQRLCVDCV